VQQVLASDSARGGYGPFLLESLQGLQHSSGLALSCSCRTVPSTTSTLSVTFPLTSSEFCPYTNLPMKPMTLMLVTKSRRQEGSSQSSAW